MLLVVVRSGVIRIDMQILASSLQDVLLPLMQGDLKYHIVTSGTVPLRKAEGFGTFRFPKNLIGSFEVLEESLFPRLPALKSLQLQPLSLLLKSERLGFKFSMPIVMLAAVTLVLGAWYLLTPKRANASRQGSFLGKISGPYMAYYQALTKPSVDKQLVEVITAIDELYLLPGWTATKLHFNGKNYHISLVPDGGEMRLITQWAKERNYQFHLSSLGAKLTYQPKLSSRPRPSILYSNEQVAAQIREHLDKLLDSQAVSLGAAQQHGNVLETPIIVRFKSVSPELLDLVGRELSDLPLELKSLDIKLHSGLMSGAIQLSVWGR